MVEPNLTDWLSALGGIISAVAALAAIGYAGKQLKGLVRQLRNESFAHLLTLEIEMNERKQRVDEAMLQLRKLDLNGAKPEDIIIEGDFLDACIENWLNLVDRFAYCLRKGIFKEREYRTEYKRYFSELVSRHPDYFEADTNLENIIFICRRWKISLPEKAIQSPEANSA